MTIVSMCCRSRVCKERIEKETEGQYERNELMMIRLSNYHRHIPTDESKKRREK